MSHIAALIGRILIAVLFIVSGFGKLLDVVGTEAMITGAGLPANLALPTGVFEILAGLCLVLGFMTRFAAILLAGFSLLAAILFHNQLTDPIQQAMALKNLAIAGGLLGIFAHSQMRWSYDSMKLERRAEVAERDAADKVREAEMRAARAEGRAEAPVVAPHTEPTVVAPAPGQTIIAEPVDSLTQPKKKWF